MSTSKTFFFVNAGTDASHIDFICKTFDKQKDAIAYYETIDSSPGTDTAYKEVKTNEGILVRKNQNGHEYGKYKISIFGIDFESHKRTDLLKEVKSWMVENDENLSDILKYNGFEYYGNIERTCTLELVSTIHLLNNMVKKSLRSENELINNYKAL